MANLFASGLADDPGAAREDFNYYGKYDLSAAFTKEQPVVTSGPWYLSPLLLLLQPEIMAKSACSIEVHDRFGPTVVSSCLNGFDFTLLFEESVLTLLPLLFTGMNGNTNFCPPTFACGVGVCVALTLS